jgi:hypothetical protein
MGLRNWDTKGTKSETLLLVFQCLNDKLSSIGKKHMFPSLGVFTIVTSLRGLKMVITAGWGIPMKPVSTSGHGKC